MEPVTFHFQTKDGTKIHCHQWIPSEDNRQIRGAVQIAHGMAEHSLRYQRFATALNEAGFAVFANDHRGHGKTAGSIEEIGYFADENGWNLVVDDMRQLTAVIREKSPAVPIFLFGHSLGSLLARSYITRYAADINGVILSATGGDPGLLGKMGMVIAKMERALRGGRHRSKLLMALSFGKFNRPFEPARTEYDWLSRDTQEVDTYVRDPYCGGIFTAGFFVDMLSGIIDINRSENIASIPKNLPVYLLSGDQDPVGNNKLGVIEVAESLKKASLDDVSCRFYTGARHEILNETNRAEVFAEIVTWIENHLPKVDSK